MGTDGSGYEVHRRHCSPPQNPNPIREGGLQRREAPPRHRRSAVTTATSPHLCHDSATSSSMTSSAESSPLLYHYSAVLRPPRRHHGSRQTLLLKFSPQVMCVFPIDLVLVIPLSNIGTRADLVCRSRWGVWIRMRIERKEEMKTKSIFESKKKSKQ